MHIGMDQTLYNIMIDIDLDEVTDEHVDTDVIEKEDEEPDECLAPPDPILTTSRRSTSDYAGKDGHTWSRKPKSRAGRAARQRNEYLYRDLVPKQFRLKIR